MSEQELVCPHCEQGVLVDSAMGGGEVQCPHCQGGILVPHFEPVSQPAPAPTRPVAPGGGKARKKFPLVAVIVVVVLVVAGAVSLPLLTKSSDSPESGSSGGSVGVRQEAGAPKIRGEGSTELESELESESESEVASASDFWSTPKVIQPAVYTMDINKAVIPPGPANGTIAGRKFVTARGDFQQEGLWQILKLMNWDFEVEEQSEMLIYIHYKGRTPGTSISVPKDSSHPYVPQIVIRWHDSAAKGIRAAVLRRGFVAKIEFGQEEENTIPAKVYVALPDADKTVVAGNVDVDRQATRGISGTRIGNRIGALWQFGTNGAKLQGK